MSMCVIVVCFCVRRAEGRGLRVRRGRTVLRAASPSRALTATNRGCIAMLEADAVCPRVRPQSRALPRLALTAVPRATLCRGLSTKVEPDPWILEEYEATDVTPPELFGYCALHPPPAARGPTGRLHPWPLLLCAIASRGGACVREALNCILTTCRSRASRRQPPSSAVDSVRPDTGHGRGRVHLPHRHCGGPGEHPGPIFGGLWLRSPGGHELYPRRGVLAHSGWDQYPGEAGQKRSSGWNRHWQLCDHWCGLGGWGC